jgi:lipopolysaccharide transport system permease protein/teichoic acid transport system permease protein
MVDSTLHGKGFALGGRSLLGDAWYELRSVMRYRELVRYMVVSALKTENTGRVFGRLWWLLDPFLIMLTYVMLIKVIYKAGGDNYAVFVFISVVVWKWFSSASELAIIKVISTQYLMKQVPFPKSVLPLSSTFGATIDFCFGLIAVIAFALAYGIYPHPELVFLPVLALITFALTLGFAFFLSGLNVFFRDVQNLASHGFRVWFYLSPGLYTLELVPDRFEPVFKLNPFATILPAFHEVLMDHSLPPFGPVALVGAVSAVVLVAGYLFFVRVESAFVKAI